MRWLPLLLVLACGGGSRTEVCHRLGTWNAAAHQGDCQNQLSNSLSESGCMAADCTDTDLRGVASYADCLDSLPVCQRSTELTFFGEMMGCQNILTMRVRFQCANGL